MIRTNPHSRADGFTLIEILAVIGLIALMVGGTMIGVDAMWGNLKFKRQVGELMNTFQMAREAASASDRRYQIALNRTVQGYVFREYTETQLVYDNNIYENALAGDYDDSVIQVREFDVATLTLEDVEYDYYTEEELALDLDKMDVYFFVAGRSGWQCGARILLRDADGNPWTIVIYRFGRPPELLEGEWDMASLGMVPQIRENVPF